MRIIIFSYCLILFTSCTGSESILPDDDEDFGQPGGIGAQPVDAPPIPQNCHCDDKYCYCPKKPKPALPSGTKAPLDTPTVTVYKKIPGTSPGVDEMGECPAAYYSTACAISHFKEVGESYVPDDWRQLESQVCVHDETGVVCYDDDPAIPKNCRCDEAKCYCPEPTKGLTCKAKTACAVYERGVTDWGWTSYEAVGVSYLPAERGDLMPVGCVCEQEQCKCPSLVSSQWQSSGKCIPNTTKCYKTHLNGEVGLRERCLALKAGNTNICFVETKYLISECIAKSFENQSWWSSWTTGSDPCQKAGKSECGKEEFENCVYSIGCKTPDDYCKDRGFDRCIDAKIDEVRLCTMRPRGFPSQEVCERTSYDPCASASHEQCGQLGPYEHCVRPGN